MVNVLQTRASEDYVITLAADERDNEGLPCNTPQPVDDNPVATSV